MISISPKQSAHAAKGVSVYLRPVFVRAMQTEKSEILAAYRRLGLDRKIHCKKQGGHHEEAYTATRPLKPVRFFPYLILLTFQCAVRRC